MINWSWFYNDYSAKIRFPHVATHLGKHNDPSSYKYGACDYMLNYV
jgi:hypothetical protein